RRYTLSVTRRQAASRETADALYVIACRRASVRVAKRQGTCVPRLVIGGCLAGGCLAVRKRASQPLIRPNQTVPSFYQPLV
ncbi:hypothetical protein BHE74_00038094, partial [Ensete ventricosum]